MKIIKASDDYAIMKRNYKHSADIESATDTDPREYAFRAWLKDWLVDLNNDIQSGSIDDFSSDEEFESYVYDEVVVSDYWWSTMSRDCAEFVQTADESLISSIIKEETDNFYNR